MEELLQLMEIVTPNKLKELALITPSSNKPTNIYQLYKAIVDGEYENEDELMNLLFEEGAHQRSNFNRTKRGLKERLINSLFIIDTNESKYKDITQAYYYCYKNAAAVKILIGKRARNVAISLAKKTFRVAEKFEFTDILLTLSKDLRMHYGSIEGNKRKFTYYNEKTKYYSAVLMAELKAEEYFSEVAILHTLSRASSSDQKEFAQLYSEELEELIKKYHSYRLNLFSYTVIAIQFEMAHDYTNTINTCERALRYFAEKKHLTSNLVMFNFLYRKISSQILLGRLPQALDTTKKCARYVWPGFHNWFKLQEYRFIIHAHSNNFSKALDSYRETVEHKNFSNQYPDTKEAWYIYEAYIYYFYLRKAIKGPLNERLKKFRLNKFLNEVPTYSKDKRGMNIAILILQVLFLLHQEKYGKIIDRVEALRTYTHRYLRRDETFRSNCFIKMLMQLPRANFHKAAVIRKTADLREKLSSVGIRHNQSAEVEAVPYEVLWEFVLGSLKHKIH